MKSKYYIYHPHHPFKTNNFLILYDTDKAMNLFIVIESYINCVDDGYKILNHEWVMENCEQIKNPQEIKRLDKKRLLTRLIK